MKNNKVLWSVVIIGVLVGIALLNRKKTESSEPAAESPESTVDAPAQAEAPAPSQTSPTPLASPAPDSAGELEALPTETANSMPDDAVSVPPDAVASTIKKNLAGAKKLLQQKAAIEKSKSEDVHHTPKVTVDAARRLGEIAELEAQHPEQAETFREFYLECARDDSTMTVTRAQCLDRYIKAAKLDAAAQKQFLAEFPEEIVRLVEASQ
ncbi:MAG TPA: hypothetical protein VFO10_06380 [Oligoflexus sp.]|uniref:hypothetical protein n=1 Tax=Oligoflexus sp. TaxID=1971216 RepID=UPI002D7F3A7D|nr:hypothetical protein [Oligoflexus sp.]HET9236857.1 hypothetical protein [Oligoflexus sp.]